MGCGKLNQFLPSTQLASILVGIQGANGQNANNSDPIKVAFKNDDLYRGSNVFRLSDTPNYEFEVFNKPPSTWEKLPQDGSVVTDPTLTSGYVAAQGRIKEYWKSTAGNIGARAEMSGVIEILASQAINTEILMFTLPTGLRPVDEHTFILPVINSGDFVLMTIKTNGQMYVRLGSSYTSENTGNIQVDVSAISYDATVSA